MRFIMACQPLPTIQRFKGSEMQSFKEMVEFIECRAENKYTSEDENYCDAFIS